MGFSRSFRASPAPYGLTAALSILALALLLAVPDTVQASPHHTAADAYYGVDRVSQDCTDCPQMMTLPAGSFVMGSDPSEATRSSQEGPQHRVVIGKPFAIGIYPVTVGQYSAFIRETGRDGGAGCIIYKDGKSQWVAGADWRHPGYAQTERHPVTCIDWDDAHAYIRWLNAKARTHGGRYRLPSEAEWEYAARAGSTTPYYWGDDAAAACRYANEADLSLGRAAPEMKSDQCDDSFVATSPVGAFPANAFGLYDMAGNVFQWIEDCYHPSYDGAPLDGSIWSSGTCAEHVIRGGSHGHTSRLLRSAYRFKDPPEHRSIFLGLRVVKDLN